MAAPPVEISLRIRGLKAQLQVFCLLVPAHSATMLHAPVWRSFKFVVAMKGTIWASVGPCGVTG